MLDEKIERKCPKISLTTARWHTFYMSTGLPEGVVNMVFGTGKNAGAAIVQHPKINLLSFTGSTAVGKYIQEKSAQHMKKLSLEVKYMAS